MKKVVLALVMLVFVFSLTGCGKTEKGTEINLDTPEGITMEYIKTVDSHQYSKAIIYLTEQYKNTFVTMADVNTELKSFDVLGEESIAKGPDVLTTKGDKSKIWYKYASGKYIYFQLLKENNIWKIDSISFWFEKEDGDPKKVKIE